MNQRNIVMFPVATGQGRMDKLEGDEIRQVLSMYEGKYIPEYYIPHFPLDDTTTSLRYCPSLKSTVFHGKQIFQYFDLKEPLLYSDNKGKYEMTDSNITNINGLK